MFLRVKTGEQYGTKQVLEEIINSDNIRSVIPRTGHDFPMSTIFYVQGTKGHWEAAGANTVVREIHVWHSFDEMCVKLGITK